MNPLFVGGVSEFDDPKKIACPEHARGDQTPLVLFSETICETRTIDGDVTETFNRARA